MTFCSSDPVRSVVVVVMIAALTACSPVTEPPALGAPCECPTGYPCDVPACGEGAVCDLGTCAIRCGSAADCPTGAVCLEGGACAWPCESADECPAGLDRCDGACYGGPLLTGCAP